MHLKSFIDKSVLVIGDEIPISKLLYNSLSKEGLRVREAYTGRDGFGLLNEGYKPDIIILDLMLPDCNGFDLCKDITSRYTIPVIILTAKASIVDKVLGLEIGADDYITKPFDILELVARVRTSLRRNSNHRLLDKISVLNNIEIYKNERKVLKKGTSVELTPKEYELLVYLAENRGNVYSRPQLLNKIWGYEYEGETRTVDIHILRLRKKLDNHGSPSLIETVFGVGYKMTKNS